MRKGELTSSWVRKRVGQGVHLELREREGRAGRSPRAG